MQHVLHNDNLGFYVSYEITFYHRLIHLSGTPFNTLIDQGIMWCSIETGTSFGECLPNLLHERLHYY